MSVGDRFELTGLSIEILRTDPDGTPVEAAYTFSMPLEDASLRWLRWEDGRYVPFSPPGVGGSVALPASFGLLDAFRR